VKHLPDVKPLTWKGDLAARMVAGMDKYLRRATAEHAAHRQRTWKRDTRSWARYEQSVAPNRQRLAKFLGVVDERVEVEMIAWGHVSSRGQWGREDTPAQAGYSVQAVRWTVLPGLTAEGLLLEPEGEAVADVVALGDADWAPEEVGWGRCGREDTPAHAGFAGRLAASGCRVLIPTLINRDCEWSGVAGCMTNQPHREFIYRAAYELGRHVIGLEVQKVLAAVDWFERENAGRPAPVAVAGHGEGGLLALYSAALDPRIRAALVSGYFQGGRQIWKEPVYRDVWGLEREFGDAEIAALAAPRALVIEAARGPEVSGPPPQTRERSNATPNGALTTPALESVRAEAERARGFLAQAGGSVRLAVSGGGRGEPGSDAALAGLLESLGVKHALRPAGPPPSPVGKEHDPERMRRQVDQLVAHTQRLVKESPRAREKFWASADSSTPARWKETTRFHRDYIWDEVIGRMPPPSLPANPRARLVFDQPRFRGYEVMLDVWPDVFAYGILLLPKDIKPGERRPVVVCQHGLEGRPRDVADPSVDNPAYHRYAVRLAEEGFITFAPQNPYIGEDRFRLIQRKGHPLKLALFSFILGQHQRLLEWLAAQPYVDPARIGFYGLSYGGKTAVRVPPLLDGYALSICSADFNEWVWKTTSVDARYTYMLTREYDMYEFDFANVVNYAELAALMAPRPFMVERGHHDGVAPDEWVAYEFARVRFFYDTRMNLPEHSRIEFFNGPHSINGQGTFEFLRRHLKRDGR